MFRSKQNRFTALGMYGITHNYAGQSPLQVPEARHHLQPVSRSKFLTDTGVPLLVGKMSSSLRSRRPAKCLNSNFLRSTLKGTSVGWFPLPWAVITMSSKLIAATRKEIHSLALSPVSKNSKRNKARSYKSDPPIPFPFHPTRLRTASGLRVLKSLLSSLT